MSAVNMRIGYSRVHLTGLQLPNFWLDRFTYKPVKDISLSFWNGGFVAEAGNLERKVALFSSFPSIN